MGSFNVKKGALKNKAKEIENSTNNIVGRMDDITNILLNISNVVWYGAQADAFLALVKEKLVMQNDLKTADFIKVKSRGIINFLNQASDELDKLEKSIQDEIKNSGKPKYLIYETKYAGSNSNNTTRESIIDNPTPTNDTKTTSTTQLPANWVSPFSNERVNNQKEIYTFLKEDMGLNDAAVAGVMGNIARESGFNENSSGMDTNGYYSNGLFQWNEKFTARGKYGATVNDQLNYMKKTINGIHPSTYEKLLAVPNTEEGAREAALIFAKQYEICDPRTYGDRQEYASDFYDSF